MPAGRRLERVSVDDALEVRLLDAPVNLSGSRQTVLVLLTVEYQLAASEDWAVEVPDTHCRADEGGSPWNF